MRTRIFRFFLVSSLTLATVLLGAVPGQARTLSGVAARRTAWLYNNGSFKKLRTGEWLEVNPTGRFNFREQARNDFFVTLADPSRNVRVRLYSETAYVVTPQQPRWNMLYQGRWEDPRKKPLNEDRLDTERARLGDLGQRLAFPHLGREYEVLGPATKTYNCIAWSMGITDRWVWPGKNNKATVKDFDDLYGQIGFRRVIGLNFDRQAGVEKIVLYAKRVQNGGVEPTHGARQLADGSWSSKLGALPLIRHLEPDDLDGNSYGVPYAVYVRVRR